MPWLFLKGLAKFIATNAICCWVGGKDAEPAGKVPASCLWTLCFPPDL